ncbi:thiamine phosphate synthase [Legionella parisiensis]|uniref:Thiamine-phosphate synthase n=1 Tax=Legionella parisiensis TaxID=45071 RepID=A0A1E5JP86_9GAMM|nr:thiamine phosphate synthase [Legionella parisiensis]KTD41975.1 phosphomethylpyrimidine kinase/thiamin-phosphate pyrophosphorylase [Legionella parisiensis]OEH46339.1 Thiamine-phosphate synthase [Legionella parisiensis]STX75597.1 phosphomethylpyrimidine kinase/thiamin-phosphate pyrophosphorylase [Legionella parisiensis]
MSLVWTKAENEADRHTFRGLGLKLQSQLFYEDAQPDAIKINGEISSEDLDCLSYYSGPVVFDFTLASARYFGEKNLSGTEFSFADVLVLNTLEAEFILKRKIMTHQSMEEAAHGLLAYGAKSIFLLGQHGQGASWRHDYWTNGVTSFWLTKNHCSDAAYPELRSVLSAAITASLALGYVLKDALIIAKMYVHQAVRRAQTGLYYGNFPEDETDLPYLSSKPLYSTPPPFKRCHRLGLYPVVDRFSWVEMLLSLGVKTIQLRIKERTNNLEEEIRQSIALAKKHYATLFINDYWEMALKLNAEAVHLGQSDIDNADIDAIRKQGLLLGVSTHCYYEVARAHALNPSYIAIGPVFPTTSKEMPFTAQGILSLQRWKRTLNYPLVAIGGINVERMPDVVATGVQGVALISAITHVKDPQKATEQLLRLI